MAPVGIAGLFPSFYLAPQNRADARAMYDAGVEQLGLSTTRPSALPGPRMTGIVIALSREFGSAAVGDALLEAADGRYEPIWDRQRGEFTWGFGFGEPHPRGQYNATMATAEAMSEGAWTRLFNDPRPRRFEEPTVVGVDFPAVTLRQAWWDAERARLTLATSPQNESVAGRPTSFSVTNLAIGPNWQVAIDGRSRPGHRLPNGDVQIQTTIGRHRIEVHADS